MQQVSALKQQTIELTAQLESTRSQLDLTNTELQAERRSRQMVEDRARQRDETLRSDVEYARTQAQLDAVCVSCLLYTSDAADE